jgi:aspartate/methionine/tyrosine aminotransferase
VGCIYREELIRATVDFAERNDLHVILDELYFESFMPGFSAFSGLSITSSLIHVVYGFAKDFGLSGFKVGVLHSENPEVIGAVQNCAYFHAVSMQTQRTLANLLNHPGLDRFLDTMRRRLHKSCERAATLLSDPGIAYLPPEGGIVLWLDLRPFLDPCTFKEELRLFQDLFDSCRVSVSPGQAFHCAEPGWFRLCFSVPPEHLEEGMTRLLRYLASRNRRA